MTQEEKVAIARVLSDVVKADGHLSIEQFCIAQEVHEEYHLNQEHVSQSRGITFSDALKALKNLTVSEKKTLRANMKRVAFAGKVCQMQEALLLAAMDYVFDKDVTMVYAPTPNPTLGKEINMVYMESEYNEVLNEEMDDDRTYRLVHSQCSLDGINFSYIPRITSEFANLEKDDVVNILRYMSPMLSEEEAANVGRRMGELTTSEFYLKVLHLPMQNVVNPPKEFLLVGIGISMTPYCQADGKVKYFKDYLCLPINGSILETIDEFRQIYKSYASVTYPIVRHGHSYYDFMFYKLFFDFLLTPPPVMPDLYFLGQEPKSGKYSIAFRFGDNEKVIYLTPKEYEAFYEIVKRSAHSKSKGLPIGFDRTNLAPVVSHIRQKIRNEMPEIALAEKFKPERSGNVYTVNTEHIKVFVRHYNSVTEWEDKPL